MFTEALAIAPVFVGGIVYGTLGVVALTWLVTRTRSFPGVQESGSL